jgi:uncharacterized protein YjbJ (UPF0337 family)
MVEEQIEGALTNGVGHLQDGVGGLLGDIGLQAKGKLNQAAGNVQNAYGQIKDLALDAAGQARVRAEDAYGDIGVYVREQPVKALVVGLGLGLLLGALIIGKARAVHAAH